MEEKYLVSVIVPVYNVEQYLEKCVNSIFQQTYKKLEIILVDDGSFDSSGTLCDKFEKVDNRVVVIHKINGGLSDARNKGIEIAKGDYITFVDSDDFVSPIFIETFVKAAIEGDCDLVALKGGKSFWDREDSPTLYNSINDCCNHYVDSIKTLECMLYQQIATGAPFKMYKKEIFNSLRFPVGYLFEDVATTYKALLLSKKTCIVEGDLYAYRMRRESIIRQSFTEKKLIAITIYNQLMNDQDLSNLGLHKAAVSRGYAMLFSVYLQIPYKDIQMRKKVWNVLKTGQKIVMFDTNQLMRRKNKYAAWISLLGMNVTHILGRKFGQKGSMN